ncbi:hypothetical protein C351_06312 [Cryptococcus neoformans c8]|nr:hypothetical protein C351_06312 [Cryptococcus neoformans var. grubii c8]
MALSLALVMESYDPGIINSF